MRSILKIGKKFPVNSLVFKSNRFFGGGNLPDKPEVIFFMKMYDLL